MSGHEVCFGRCWSCGRTFTFDAVRVPSLPVDPGSNLPSDLDGDPSKLIKQPICRACITLANEKRRENGRPLIPVLPNAYLDEP